MGEIKRVLCERELPHRELHNSRLFVDLAENVHIHFRELRLVFSTDEFFEFCDVIGTSKRQVRRYLKRHPEYEEQKIFDGLLIAGGVDRQIMPLRCSPEPHTSKYFPDRLQIELQQEKVIDAVHVHYRDYRLAMSIECFRALAEGIGSALSELKRYLAGHTYVQGSHPFRQVVAAADWKAKKASLWQRLKYKICSLLDR